MGSDSIRSSRTVLLTLFAASLCCPADASAKRVRSAASIRVWVEPLAGDVVFPTPVDSNSPLYWNDLQEMVLFTSFRHPFVSVGRGLTSLTPVGEVGFEADTPGGKWLESVIRAADGTLYGYYHSEPPGLCLESDLTEPQIGAAVSLDDGHTWRDLGVVLTATPGYLRCDTPNSYFAGGVGDFSVALDQDERYAYFLFTTYSGDAGEQGVSAARMLWSERDRPVGKLFKYFDGLWLEPGLEGRATAIFPAMPRWDEPETDAFWGPSVHWNSELRAYVMLLNRDLGTTFTNEGTYVAFASELEDPWLWSTPQKIIEGGGWYPQVVGLEGELGTDKRAGREAWLCIHGACSYRIIFESATAAGRRLAAGVVVASPAGGVPVAAKREAGPRRRRAKS